jgi:outer membrane scaffolding protein for murein synthesis (MipA/OmpV family)
LRPSIRIPLTLSGLATSLVIAAPASAEESRGWTIRVGLGTKLLPKFPGADELGLGIYPLLSRRHTGAPIKPGGPGNSPGLTLVDHKGFKFGPVAMLSPDRKAKDVGAPFRSIDSALELGVFAQYYLLPEVRVRAEARRALWEYEGWVGHVSADYIIRDRDTYAITIGPRLRFAGKRYMRTYFGVTPEEAAASGLPVHDPEGGAAAVGVATGLTYQFSYNWGMRASARYERLIGDAGDSPIVQDRGSQDQFRAGLALTYTFDLGKVF